MAGDRVAWKGKLLAVQPRILLTRAFDQRSHTYLGYTLVVEGRLGGKRGRFRIGIGSAAQARLDLRAGDEIAGRSLPVARPALESVDYYRTTGLTPGRRSPPPTAPPPWQGPPPDLDTYRARGHRRLSERAYQGRCASCIWGCRMAVEMIVNPEKPREKRYRAETFCYGPLACPLYDAGPTRTVPGRDALMWEEEDRVDEAATAHRSPDE